MYIPFNAYARSPYYSTESRGTYQGTNNDVDYNPIYKLFYKVIHEMS